MTYLIPVHRLVKLSFFSVCLFIACSKDKDIVEISDKTEKQKPSKPEKNNGNSTDKGDTISDKTEKQKPSKPENNNENNDNKKTNNTTLDLNTLERSSAFKQQWYIHNDKQGSNNAGLDLNIKPVWRMGYTGKGIHVAILDSQIDKEHPSLSKRLSRYKTYHQGVDVCIQSHGTAVAGIVGALPTDTLPVGIAPNAVMDAHAMIMEGGSGLPIDISKLTNILTDNIINIAVSNNSWTYTAGGYYLEQVLALHQAFDKGSTQGFNGKGTSYVFASGNAPFYNLASEPIFGHHAIIAVAGVDKSGKPKAFASKYGWVHWVSGFSNDIFTSDRSDLSHKTCGYAKGQTDMFAGTSAAAPMITGIIALMRQANPNLGYRDVKLILAESASTQNLIDIGSLINTGPKISNTSSKYLYSNLVGFGLVDAEKAINLAKQWQNVPQLIIEASHYSESSVQLIPNKVTDIDMVVSGSRISFVEFVQINMDFISDKDNFVAPFDLSLVDPNGIERNLFLENRLFGKINQGKTKYKTGYNLFLGKHSPNGRWKLKLKKTSSNKDRIENIHLVIYGH